MKHSVLYYPKFEPDQRWLRSVLLFIDEIQRIIPRDAEHTDSLETRRLIEVMPDAFRIVSPTTRDKEFDRLNFNRLRKAFAFIRNKTRGPSGKSLTLEFSGEGRISIDGGVWLSNAKLGERVRDLLFEYDLANDLNPLGEDVPRGDTFPVNEEAANLIVSYIADRIAKRTGLNTITDTPVPYVVQSLDALRASEPALSREGEGLLASTIANIAVPAGVVRLTALEFQELRQSFADIRGAFHELVRSLAWRTCVDRQETATALENRVQGAIAQYQKQMANYKKSAAAKKIDDWVALSLQGLISILMPISSPNIQMIEAAGVFSVEILKQRIASERNPIPHETTYRMLCTLDRQISKRAISRLI